MSNVSYRQMTGAAFGATVGIGSMERDWSIAGTADFNADDFNADGTADILWRSAGGVVSLWRMLDRAVAETTTLGSAGPDWTIVGTGDYDGDGTPDVMFRSGAGAHQYWRIVDGAVDRAVAAGAESLPGSAGNDELRGGGGNDLLLAGLGADTLHGDAGADTLMGGSGADRYEVGASSGHDRIEETADATLAPDMLNLGAEVDLNRLSLQRAGNDLILAIRGARPLAPKSPWRGRWGSSVRLGWGGGNPAGEHAVEHAGGAADPGYGKLRAGHQGGVVVRADGYPNRLGAIAGKLFMMHRDRRVQSADVGVLTPGGSDDVRENRECHTS